MHLGMVSIALFVINLPFGYWRAHAGKFSLQWFLAIHLPVLLAVCVRVATGLGWDLATYPALITAFLLGQFLGGRIHIRWKRRGRVPLTACLVCDLWKRLRPDGARAL
jgi:hypothetical protein